MLKVFWASGLLLKMYFQMENFLDKEKTEAVQGEDYKKQSYFSNYALK